jgi:hypothetical protein
MDGVGIDLPAGQQIAPQQGHAKLGFEDFLNLKRC